MKNKIVFVIIPFLILLILVSCKQKSSDINKNTKTDVTSNPTTHLITTYIPDPIQQQFLNELSENFTVIVNEKYELDNSLSIDYCDYEIVDGIKMPVPGSNKYNREETIKKADNYTIKIETNKNIEILSFGVSLYDKQTRMAKCRTINSIFENGVYKFSITSEDELFFEGEKFFIKVSGQIEYEGYKFYCIIALNLANE